MNWQKKIKEIPRIRKAAEETLEAFIDAGIEDIYNMSDLISVLNKRIEELEAEVAKLTAERDKLEAENERLRRDFNAKHDCP